MEVQRDSVFKSSVFWSDLLEDLQDPEMLAMFSEQLRQMPEAKRVQILQLIEDQQTLRDPELQESLAQLRRGETTRVDTSALAD